LFGELHKKKELPEEAIRGLIFTKPFESVLISSRCTPGRKAISYHLTITPRRKSHAYPAHGLTVKDC
jgi:hypothetical protein